MVWVIFSYFHSHAFIFLKIQVANQELLTLTLFFFLSAFLQASFKKLGSCKVHCIGRPEAGRAFLDCLANRTLLSFPNDFAEFIFWLLAFPCVSLSLEIRLEWFV